MCGFGTWECKKIRGALVILSGQVLFFYLFHGLMQKKVTSSENKGKRTTSNENHRCKIKKLKKQK